MLVLALDTTTRQGSVALARDGRTLETYVGDAATTHGVRLPGDLARVLDAHRFHVADVDLYAVASGPGSFTGLRIGIATLQGLALANDKPLAGVSALDAIHSAVSVQLSAFRFHEASRSSDTPDTAVAVWMDAQRGQVFSALYNNGVCVESALVDTPAAILARWKREQIRPALFAGDGAIAYRDLVSAADARAQIIDPVPPLAPSIAMLAEAHVRQHGPSPPDALRPIYVRRPDVELTRDRAAAPKP